MACSASRKTIRRRSMADAMNVEPALTSAEWAEFLNPANANWAALVYHNLSDHAAAAVGLHGKPFGFTPDEVAALEYIRARAWEWASEYLPEPPFPSKLREEYERMDDLTEGVIAKLR